MNRFEGRVAIVTGAARGIGGAIAKRLGAEGATVAVVDIDEDGARSTAAKIGGASFALACDIGDPDSVEALHGAAIGRASRTKSSWFLWPLRSMTAPRAVSSNVSAP